MKWGEAMAAGVVTGEGLNGIPFDELQRMTVDEYERLAESGLVRRRSDPAVLRLFGEAS